MKLTTLRLRPRFELSTQLLPDDVVARVKDKLAGRRETIAGLFAPARIELWPQPPRQHLWSPQLTIDLVGYPGGTRLDARFAPHPHVWSLYLALHALGAFATIGAAVFGVSQYLAGQSPWALWALPIAPVLAALVWALAFVGQGLGAEQMYELRRFVEEALEV